MVARALNLFDLGWSIPSAPFENWRFWTLDAEAGIHLPLGRVEPYFTVGGGYASLGAFNLNRSTLDGAGVDITGSTLAGSGIDVYVTNVVTIGDLTGDVLFLTRPGGRTPSKLTSTSGTKQIRMRSRRLETFLCSSGRSSTRLQ
ncbi:MAG: hypothetical protein QM784_39980 [Polyangiaceae bacterium]